MFSFFNKNTQENSDEEEYSDNEEEKEIVYDNKIFINENRYLQYPF